MSRMTVNIDPDLLDQAQAALGAPTKVETIRIALAEAVRKQRLGIALQNRGQIDLELDQGNLQQQRQGS